MSSEFTSQGQQEFPSIYYDTERLHDIATWTTERLDTTVNEYMKFLEGKDLMPRAREGANRIVDHILFELAFRDGIYDQIEGHVEDEACDNVEIIV